MEIDHSIEELTEATIELIQRQELPSCYIRPIAFYGYNSLGVSPRTVPPAPPSPSGRGVPTSARKP